MSVKRIVRNTVFLYGKTIIVGLIALLTVRITLSNLGLVDYGIYTLLGSLLTTLTFLNSALASSTQRYLSIELGRGRVDLACLHFNVACFIHLFFAIVVLLLGFAFGEWMLSSFLSIPIGRQDAALIIIRLVIINVSLAIISVPFQAAFNSNERMDIFAGLSVLQSFGILCGAYSLYYVNTDKLVWFCLCQTLVSFLVFLVTVNSSFRLFPECKINWKLMVSHSEIRSHLGFSGWNAFGALAYVSQNHALAVLTNIFSGPAINAAFGLAQQISGQLNLVSATLLKATTPQIIKSEGASNRDRLHRLAFASSRYAFTLMFLVGYPLYVYVDQFLSLWLGDVPRFAKEFTQYVILIALVNQLTAGLISSVQAVGRIASYQAVVGGLLIAALPVSFIYLSMGFPVETVLIIPLISALCAGGARLVFTKILVGMSIREWLSNVGMRAIFLIVFTVATDILASRWINILGGQGFGVLISTVLITSIFCLAFGVSRNERALVLTVIKSKLRKCNDKKK